MKIKFHWAVNLNLGQNKELETNMEEWLVSGHGPKPCHPGIINVYLENTDPLNHTIKGKILCEKKHIFFSFTSSPDGGTINPME